MHTAENPDDLLQKPLTRADKGCSELSQASADVCGQGWRTLWTFHATNIPYLFSDHVTFQYVCFSSSLWLISYFQNFTRKIASLDDEMREQNLETQRPTNGNYTICASEGTAVKMLASKFLGIMKIMTQHYRGQRFWGHIIDDPGSTLAESYMTQSLVSIWQKTGLLRTFKWQLKTVVFDDRRYVWTTSAASLFLSLHRR